MKPSSQIKFKKRRTRRTRKKKRYKPNKKERKKENKNENKKKTDRITINIIQLFTFHRQQDLARNTNSERNSSKGSEMNGTHHISTTTTTMNINNK